MVTYPFVCTSFYLFFIFNYYFDIYVFSFQYTTVFAMTMSGKTNYEKKRMLTISENKAKMEALGLRPTIRDWENVGDLETSKSVAGNDNEDANYSPSNDDDYDDDSLSEDNNVITYKRQRKVYIYIVFALFITYVYNL